MKFFGILLQMGNNTGIEVPENILDAQAAAVKVDINGYRSEHYRPYRRQVAHPLQCAEHRRASGIKGGDRIEVALERDDEPRIAEIPGTLLTALEARKLQSPFDALSPSARKAHVLSVEGAKTDETRQRRRIADAPGAGAVFLLEINDRLEAAHDRAGGAGRATQERKE